MKALSLTLAAATQTAITVSAHAGLGPVDPPTTETHDVFYNFNVQEANETDFFEVPQFDTQEGSRQLTGVTFFLEGSYSIDMLVENLESFGVEDGEWFVESALFMDLWLADGPIGVLDADLLGVESGDLAANDGNPLTGPDVMAWSYNGSVDGSVSVPEERLDEFVGTGTITAGIYPFLSLAINAPPPLYDLWILDHLNSGLVTVQYDFVNIPAPTSMALLGLAGLARRRRRSAH